MKEKQCLTRQEKGQIRKEGTRQEEYARKVARKQAKIGRKNRNELVKKVCKNQQILGETVCNKGWEELSQKVHKNKGKEQCKNVCPKGNKQKGKKVREKTKK